MATINLTNVSQKTPIGDTDRYAVWPATVSASSDLRYTTGASLAAYVRTYIGSAYIAASVASAAGAIPVSTASGTFGALSKGTTTDNVLLVDTATSPGIKWGQVQTASIATAAVTPEKLLPLTVSTLSEASGVAAVDMSLAGLRKIGPLAGVNNTVTFTGSNYAAGRTVTIRVDNAINTVKKELVFPSGWVFVGRKPTAILAGKVGVLSIVSFGTTEAECVAAWAVQT